MSMLLEAALVTKPDALKLRGEHVIRLKQHNGFSPESKVALRSISQDHEWVAKELSWYFTYSAGALQGICDAAEVLHATLRIDDHLRGQLDRVKAETAAEMEVRKTMQRYLDNPLLPMAAFTTQGTPAPWPHQAVAWHWAMRVKVIYLALKPGLGKTRIGADIVRGKYELGHIRPPEQMFLYQRESAALPGRVLPERWGVSGGVLVACPSGVTGEWTEQLMRWQNIRAVSISGDANRKRNRAGTKAWVHVCGYESLEAVEDNQYDGIIADEAHYLANDDSNRFQRMMNLRKSAAWAIGLSGTPIPNMLKSMWAQYYWLDGGRTLGPSFEAYRRRYLNITGRVEEEKEGAEERVSRAISRVTMFLSMEQAFPGKPRKIQQVVRIPMTTEQMAYYEQLRKRQVADIIGGKVSVVEATTRLIKLLQVTQGFVLDDEKVVQQFSSAKLKALEAMLTGDGDLTDKRTIVWCRFTADILRVSDMLTRNKVKHMTLRGGVLKNDKDKDAFKAAWNGDYTQRVLVGMISMGIGLNLNAPTCVDDKGKTARCSTTVFYGLDYKATQVEQAMDRVYRGDQVESCLYRYLLSDYLDEEEADGTRMKAIDERIYDNLQIKLGQAVNVSEEAVDYIRGLLGA